MRFRRIKERNPQSEHPSSTLKSEIPESPQIPSDRGSVDKAGQDREHEEKTKCMQCDIAELQSWKMKCGLSKFDTDYRLENLSKLVLECRNTMTSQAGQIVTLNEANKTLAANFSNHQTMVRQILKEIMRIYPDKRKHDTNHEARGGGKRQCTSETHEPTNDDTQ
ncbi:Ff.00g107700.m01.CDS01 [Fusarium sp. VM40]|nr:Ff.00g107700.m01.CDS01 [Fusarium sp. VM40]